MSVNVGETYMCPLTGETWEVSHVIKATDEVMMISKMHGNTITVDGHQFVQGRWKHVTKSVNVGDVFHYIPGRTDYRITQLTVNTAEVETLSLPTQTDTLSLSILKDPTICVMLPKSNVQAIQAIRNSLSQTQAAFASVPINLPPGWAGINIGVDPSVKWTVRKEGDAGVQTLTNKVYSRSKREHDCNIEGCEFVNVGFTSLTMACRHCDKEQGE